MDKIKIIEAGNELGLGGTEYVMQLYSKYLNKAHFDVLVLGIHNGGARVKLLEDLGIPVIILHSDMELFAKLLQEADVFHWHGDGSLNPGIFNVVKANKPKLVIQTNIFGEYTPSALYDLIDYDLFVSKMILIRRMYLDQQLENNFQLKRKTLHNPVDTDHINSLLPSDNQMERFKEQNKLSGYFIIGRIGRADNAKFDLITLDSFAAFAQKVPHTRFLLIGATKEMIAHAEVLRIADKLLIFDTTSNLEQLLYYYRSIDIFLAASHLGESFGMVIAEAMTAGIPVVTVSTPYRDNAQIELVDQGETGFVVEHDSEKLAAAIYELYQDEHTRLQLSAAAKEKIRISYRANDIVRSLENLIFAHFDLPVQQQEQSLLIDFSMQLVTDYIYRCNHLWQPNKHND